MRSASAREWRRAATGAPDPSPAGRARLRAGVPASPSAKNPSHPHARRSHLPLAGAFVSPHALRWRRRRPRETDSVAPFHRSWSRCHAPSRTRGHWRRCDCCGCARARPSLVPGGLGSCCGVYVYDNEFELGDPSFELDLDALHECHRRCVAVLAPAHDVQHGGPGCRIKGVELHVAMIDAEHGYDLGELISNLVLDISLRTCTFAAKNAHWRKIGRGKGLKRPPPCPPRPEILSPPPPPSSAQPRDPPRSARQMRGRDRRRRTAWRTCSRPRRRCCGKKPSPCRGQGRGRKSPGAFRRSILDARRFLPDPPSGGHTAPPHPRAPRSKRCRTRDPLPAWPERRATNGAGRPALTRRADRTSLPARLPTRSAVRRC